MAIIDALSGSYVYVYGNDFSGLVAMWLMDGFFSVRL